jgi:septum formation protein
VSVKGKARYISYTSVKYSLLSAGIFAVQPIILASSSPFRKQLLERLGIPFTAVNPAADETPLPDEPARKLVQRLTEAKARTVAARHPHALIIGSDQVALLNNEILGKPGTHERATEQLRRLSGQHVQFLTGLCLLNGITARLHLKIVSTRVIFRPLSRTRIEAYLQREPAYACAGSFQIEGLGISLVEKIQSNDPTALIGLPLIHLTSMLQQEGVGVP